MVNFVIRLKRGDFRVLFELFLFDFVAILKWLPALLKFIWLWLLCIGSHGCFPVKPPKYFIAEAPSNPLLNFPFKLENINGYSES